MYILYSCSSHDSDRYFSTISYKNFLKHFIKSSNLKLLSKSVLSEYNGYIIEAEDNEGNMQKTVIMTHNNSNIIIFSINSPKQEWELNSELFDLLFSSLIINQT